MRIVSLISSSTEIVFALGFGDLLVGRSHECDTPESVATLPVCTAPKFPVDGPSREIDRHVKAIVEEGLSVYRVDADRLAELEPDLIVTQTQCEVCAVSRRDVELAVSDWVGSRPRIVSLEPNSLDDVWNDIRKVADALGAPERGEELVARLNRRMTDVTRRTVGLPRPRIACIEWIEPLMACGNWMPELVQHAGGDNCFGVAGQHSPWMTFEDLCRENPDVILVVPCGFDIARTRQEMSALTGVDGWEDLDAVRGGRVLLADGNRFFNRPGPRLVEAVEMLAEILHPDSIRFGHEGDGWDRLNGR
jgi:iron complex transport system substrate-binding protein